MDFTSFSVTDNWGSGFTGYITFENFTPDPINGWSVEFDAPFNIYEMWDGQVVQQVGDRYTVQNLYYNAQVPSGNSLSFGFNAYAPPSGSIYDPVNQPQDFSLNGIQPEDPGSPGGFSYGEALQKSFLFYEAQRSGDLRNDNRIDWRDDSALGDGADVGRDLTGGYYDAGDHVKFGFPMASALTLLAWGVDEYRQAYEAMGQLDEAMDAIKWGTDYILKAHVVQGGETQTFYGQVGDGDIDHAYWGSPEDMTMERPAFAIDTQRPGTELAAESAAALAAASIVFRPSNERYADRLLNNAKKLYRFAEENLGTYHESISDAEGFYKSFSGFYDELAWGAAWLYNATDQRRYYRTASDIYDGVEYTHTWDNKDLGTAVLLSQIAPGSKNRYRTDAQEYLNQWSLGRGDVQYTSGGFAWLDEYGSARYSATAAFLAGIYGDNVRDFDGRYTGFAESQVDYLLGDNPNNFSYMVGFGDNYARQPHHRAASGVDYVTAPGDNEHILYGALVGGLTAPNDNAYEDARNNFVANEVALDYNAGFTGALARMYEQYGGDPLTDAQLDALPGISVPSGGF